MKKIIEETSQTKWDNRFMKIAKHVASWSKDPSTKCGAVLVRDDNTISSVGYNGLPKGVEDKPEYYSDRNEKYPRIIHSEWNAMQHCKDDKIDGHRVYAWPLPPCGQCTSSLLQKKIGEVVCQHPPEEQKERWNESFNLASDMLHQRKTRVRHAKETTNNLLRIPNFNFNLNDEVIPYNKWDVRFLMLASEIQTWSKYKENPRAVVIVRKDRTFCSSGFNGLPFKVKDEPLQTESKEVLSKMVLSAERNSILFSRDNNMDGYKAYCWPTPPDLNEISHLIHAGIRKICLPIDKTTQNLKDFIDPKVVELFESVDGEFEIIEWKGTYSYQDTMPHIKAKRKVKTLSF